MIAAHIEALKASNKTLVLIGALATAAAGVMTLGVGMDTPWAGEAIRNHVSSRVVHASKFRSCRCLLCNYGDLPHLPENGDQQA